LFFDVGGLATTDFGGQAIDKPASPFETGGVFKQKLFAVNTCLFRGYCSIPSKHCFNFSFQFSQDE
jgi:hypothetical protein